MAERVIHWFRRDLRLQDNTALNAALLTEGDVLALFLLDDGILQKPSVTRERKRELGRALAALEAELGEKGSGLYVVRTNDPARELNRIVEETGAWSVYFNRDYTLYARQRDTRATRGLQMTGVVTQVFDDLLLVDPYQVLDENGLPPGDFEEFRERWLDAVDFHPEIEDPGGLFTPRGDLPPTEVDWRKQLEAEKVAGFGKRHLYLGSLSIRDLARDVMRSGSRDPGSEGVAGERLNQLIERDYAYLRIFATGRGRNPDLLR